MNMPTYELIEHRLKDNAWVIASLGVVPAPSSEHAVEYFINKGWPLNKPEGHRFEVREKMGVRYVA
jgi:predicted alternative tryptophan synthase beta-subunit